jgi:hypothetical protein
VTAVNKPLVPVPIERKEFSRTELKRLVRQVPLTVVTDDQLSVAVERVLGGERMTDCRTANSRSYWQKIALNPRFESGTWLNN